MSNLGKCRDCGATVLWSTTAKGRKVALNPLMITIAMRIINSEEGPVAIRQAHAVHFDTCAKRRASQRTRA